MIFFNKQNRPVPKVLMLLMTIFLFSGVALATNVTIIHVNDTHSHLEASSESLYFNGVKTYLSLGGVAKMATKIKEIKQLKPDSLVLHAGDAVQGTLYYTKFEGEADLYFLNAMGFDAMVLGNHEFDKGPEVVASFDSKANFPIISANLKVHDDPYVTDQFEPYITREIDGKMVAIFGLTTARTSEIASPGDYISFEDETTAAQRIVDELKNQGINMIIALTHMGFDADIALAEAVTGIDVIVGGHSHTLLGDMDDLGLSTENSYPYQVQNPDGKDVCIVQAWEWGKVLGIVDVTFDDNGEVISCAGDPVLLADDDFLQKDADGNKVAVSPEVYTQLVNLIENHPNIDIVEPDAEMLTKLNTEYKPAINVYKETVVATISKTLYHIREPGIHTLGEILLKGSMVAPHVCEAMCWFPEDHVDMSIQNAGGVRIDLAEGNLTVANVYELLPFGNQLVIMELTGSEIKETLEIGVDRSGGAFPYVGRARYHVNMYAPKGNRVRNLMIKNPEGTWLPVVSDQTYKVATNAYIAGGGDGYSVLKSAEGDRYDTGFVDAEVFEAYAKNMGTLDPPNDTGVYYMHLIETPSTKINMYPVGTYATHALDESAAEIPSYDPVTKRLFMVNGADGSIDIMDLSDPFVIDRIDNIDLSQYGKAANSCAFMNGILAVAVENNVKQAPGKAVLFNADGEYIKDYPAGALPDMIKFAPNGKIILVANEGEPNADYDNDPEGSVTVIDITNGADNGEVFQATFTAFNDQKESLQEKGVRIFGQKSTGEYSTVAEDLEPEYIAVSKDSKTAWIALQENNALAVLDIDTKTITHILPFGYKDHSLPENSLDVSDKDDRINMQTWPILGMYMPDSIDAFKIEDTHYIITANEGDSRDYDGFSEEERVKDITLDPEVFTNASELQDSEALGRLKISTVIGDEDQDGNYETLYSYGARSFSIWRQDDDQLTLVYDSANEFEQIVNSILYLRYGDSEDAIFDNRNDDKGVEPEGIAVGQVDGRIYAFIGLERFSGLMIYDISDPEQPEYVKFLSRQNLDQELETGLAEDVAPEGVLFIPAEDSPTGKAMVVLGNEVSGTTTAYEISGLKNPQNPNPEAIVAEQNDFIQGIKTTLDATESIHENGIIVAYQWEQIDGPAVSFQDANSPIVSFVVPLSENDTEELEFQLTVTDINGLTDTVTKTIVSEKAETVKIYEIQGDGESSPLEGEFVSTEGVVTADFQDDHQIKAFFIQSESPDNNPETSEGILVYNNDTDVRVGDRVQVIGKVYEYKTLTEIIHATIIILDNGIPLPEPSKIHLPLASEDALEAFEGMRVKLTQRLTVSDVYSLGKYGQFTVSNGRLMIPTSVVSPGEEAQNLAGKNKLNQIIIGDPSDEQNPDPVIFPNSGLTAENSLRAGHEIENVVGVLRYAYGYQVHPTESFDLYKDANPRLSEPPHTNNHLTVASFNVLNYFNGDDFEGSLFPTERGADTEEEFIRQRNKIINAIIALRADVVGLMEIENDGFGDESAIQDLINGLNDKDNRTYAFVDPGLEKIGTDVITVGIIYDTNRVEEAGNAATLTTDAFADLNRPPLAQSFKDLRSNEIFTVVVNHFKSKGCYDVTGENADQGDGQGCWNPVRTQASIDLMAWLDTNPTGADDPDLLIIGDLNAYAMEDPIRAFEEKEFTNLSRLFHGKKAYSYVYYGQAGYMDYAISSKHLTPHITSVYHWAINADEPTCLDYNTEYKSEDQIEDLYSDSPFRSSDHDPVIIGLDLRHPSMWPVIRLLQVLSGFDVSAAPSLDFNKDDEINLADVLACLQNVVNMDH